ncbi:MAG: hypothetical protein RLZZ437_773 [Pseudomonadota bacterium]|jgi:hypothetical protein
MDLIADILLTSGAFGAGIYCYVLAARLKKFTTLETGMGGAIAVLSAQVDDMTRALEAARSSATGSVSSLTGLAERSEAAARRLELLMATLHDLPSPSKPEPATAAAEEEEEDDDKKLRFVRRRSSREFAEAAE